MIDVRLMKGDCLEVMHDIPDGSVDMVMADPPYGITACKWDSVIPLEPMWKELKRVVKKNGAIVMTANQPFTTTLIVSNMKMFKYSLYWDKILKSGHLNAKKMPMRQIENVVVFGLGKLTYNPIMVDGSLNHSQGTRKNITFSDNYGKQTANYENRAGSEKKYPSDLLSVQKVHPSKCVHPTQKPVVLMEYLIKTYTYKSETVLDFCMGSGTTGIACINLKMNFIGIELSEEDNGSFELAKERIEKHHEQVRMSKPMRPR